MIIDFRRQMSDEEYERYLDMLCRHYDKKWMNDELREELGENLNLAATVDRMIYSDEEKYLEDLKGKINQCITHFHKRGWSGHGSLLDHDPIFWADRQNIQYAVIYDVMIYNSYWLMFKNPEDYKTYRAKFHSIFNGGIFLLKQGWIKEQFISKEATRWAYKELGDDFLYDSNTQVYYFKPEAAMAFKLTWAG